MEAMIGKLEDYFDWPEEMLTHVVRSKGERRQAVMRASIPEKYHERFGLDDTGDGGTGGGDAGDVGVDRVPVDELDADLDQGTVRKTIRGLDQGAVAAIREVTGASSDAEAVRKAVALAKDALVED